MQGLVLWLGLVFQSSGYNAASISFGYSVVVHTGLIFLSHQVRLNCDYCKVLVIYVEWVGLGGESVVIEV